MRQGKRNEPNGEFGQRQNALAADSKTGKVTRPNGDFGQRKNVLAADSKTGKAVSPLVRQGKERANVSAL